MPDDPSRFVVASKLCATVRAGDVLETLDSASAAFGLDRITVVHRPGPLTGSGSGTTAGDLAERLDGWGMARIRGEPRHPQTQIERCDQTLKTRILMESCLLPPGRPGGAGRRLGRAL